MSNQSRKKQKQKMVWCLGCSTMKPAGEFHRNKKQPTGYQTFCKDCQKKAREEYIAKAPERREQHAGKNQKCKGCRKWKPIETYAHDSTTATGYRAYCPECRNKQGAKSNFVKFIMSLGYDNLDFLEI